MQTLVKAAVIAAASAVLAASAAAPASAHWTRHHHHHAWMHHGYGAYAYAPRHRGAIYSGSTENERRCMKSPGSLGFEPCMNKP